MAPSSSSSNNQPSPSAPSAAPANEGSPLVHGTTHLKPPNATNHTNTHTTKNQYYQTMSTPPATTDESEHSDSNHNEDQPMTHQGKASNTTKNKKSKNNLWLLVSVAAATAATLGYDVGIMAAAIQPLEHQMQLTGLEKEIAMGSLNFVAALGAFLGGHVADTYGRKRTIVVCCWLFILGTIVMAVAWNYAALVAGRIITGMGVGVAFVAAPSYITEVAPTSSRGQLNAVFDISINGGILMGYIVGFIVQWAVPDNWRLMLACGVLLPMIVLCLVSRLPESPRYCMLKGDKEQALSVLYNQLGCTLEDAQHIVKDMQDEIHREQQSEELHPHGNCWCHSLSSGQCYAVQLGFWQQITGTEAVLYYSADYLLRAGLESPLMRLGGNVLVGICKLTPECIAMQYIDTAGRRPLLFSSAVALMLSTGSLAVALYVQASPTVTVVLLCAVMASFSAGLGPFTFLSASENLSMSERAAGITYCTAANRITSGTVAMTAVTLSSLLGDAGLFALYAAAGFLSLCFYWRVPETAGVSLEELAAARLHKDHPEDDLDADRGTGNSSGVELRDTPPRGTFQALEAGQLT